MMTRVAVICVFAALTACSQAEPVSKAEDAQAPAAEQAAVASWPVEPGTYEYTRSDGRAGVNTVAADGTYSNAITGGVVETGKWSNEGELSCLVSDEGGERRCYTFTRPDAEGNLTGTMESGVTITLRKVS